MNPNAPVPEIVIRPAVRPDVPLVLRFVHELAAYERAPEQVVATEASLEQFLFGKGFGRGPVVDALIAELGGEPVGFALFFSNFSTWVGTSGIYLEDLFVRPEARGRGVGRALLREVARIAVERGCGRVEWSVLNWNTPAIDFYRRLGAAPMSEWTTYRIAGDRLRDAAGPA